jgi:hypothetical protein
MRKELIPIMSSSDIGLRDYMGPCPRAAQRCADATAEVPKDLNAGARPIQEKLAQRDQRCLAIDAW